MKKDLFISILYVVTPISLGILTGFIFNTHLLLLIIIFYCAELFFLIPSDTFFGSMLDYNTKVVNHTYRPDRKEFKNSGSKKEFWNIILVLFCLLFSILTWYFLA